MAKYGCPVLLPMKLANLQIIFKQMFTFYSQEDEEVYLDRRNGGKRGSHK